jgi:hypothetical protein
MCWLKVGWGRWCDDVTDVATRDRQLNVSRAISVLLCEAETITLAANSGSIYAIPCPNLPAASFPWPPLSCDICDTPLYHTLHGSQT